MHVYSIQCMYIQCRYCIISRFEKLIACYVYHVRVRATSTMLKLHVHVRATSTMCDFMMLITCPLLDTITCACHLNHVDVEISSGYSICLAVISLKTWVHYYYLTTSVGYVTIWKRALQKLQKLVFIAFLLDIPGLAVTCYVPLPYNFCIFIQRCLSQERVK